MYEQKSDLLFSAHSIAVKPMKFFNSEKDYFFEKHFFKDRKQAVQKRSKVQIYLFSRFFFQSIN